MELAGEDAWTIAFGESFRGKVTPAFDPDLASIITNVLDGSQSAYVKTAVHAGREWNGLEEYVQDGLGVSWLMQAGALTRTEVYLSPDVAGVSTPIGVLFDVAENIRRQTPN